MAWRRGYRAAGSSSVSLLTAMEACERHAAAGDAWRAALWAQIKQHASDLR
ncbi:hypothetical protein [Chloroflexus sp.]|uniref:hypothetical protein n=1 Tax=Chloroflexus sp. TaxID=1904827 RepID=UPI002ACE3844|nr:hypothetical protein [Chloroflexus sp.]